MTFQKVVWSSKSGKWNTPDEVFSDLHKEFNFTFDPAVPPRIGNFSGNGLKEPWHGRVFLNPEYGRSSTKRWVLKGWKELFMGHIELVVFLLPSRTGTDWFQFLMLKEAEFRINRGRLKFGDAKTGAPFDSLVAILRKENVQ